MGFGVGAYAKIKSVEETTDKVTKCKITISRRNPNNQQYELCFTGFVRFVGKAHLQRPMADQRIKIVNCDVSNAYVRDGVVGFNKNPVYTIFEYELQQSEGGSSNNYSPSPQYNPYSQTGSTAFEEFGDFGDTIPF